MKQEVASDREANKSFFDMAGESLVDKLYHPNFFRSLYCMNSVIPGVPKFPGEVPHFPNERGDPYFA